MSLTIALDMDDVVVDFVAGVLEAANRDYGGTLQPRDIKGWNFGEFGLDELLGQDWWKWMEAHAWLWAEKFKPVPGAIGGIEVLRAAGHEVELLTSKPPWAEWTVWAWVAKYRPPVNRVTIVPHVVTKDGQNAGKPAWSQAQVLVDDRDKNVDEWTEASDSTDLRAPHSRAILFDRPHNYAHVLGPRQSRARNWRHVLELIEDLEEGRW